MPVVSRGYLLGLGSNINPRESFADIIHLLLKCFGHIHLSRVLDIPPVGMNSHRYFLNAVAFIDTEMCESDLKNICNQVEISLGRDRDDPDSKTKDRPADLDILTFIKSADDWQRSASSITDEYFLYPLIDELRAYLTGCRQSATLQQGQRLETDGLAFGETATTIYRDGDTG